MFVVSEVEDEGGLEVCWDNSHHQTWKKNITSQLDDLHLTRDNTGRMYFQHSLKKPEGLHPVMSSMIWTTRSEPGTQSETLELFLFQIPLKHLVELITDATEE